MVRNVCRVQLFSAGSRNSLKYVRKSQMITGQVALLRLRFRAICDLLTDSLLYIRINKEINKSTSLAVSMQLFWSTGYEDC
jgi:hypothetical protein